MDAQYREIIIKKVDILESFFINALNSLNIKEDIEVEKMIDKKEFDHIDPIMTISFGDQDKFEITVYKKSSFDDYSFDYYFKVLENPKYNLYSELDVFEEDINHMDNKLVKGQIKKQIENVFTQYYKIKSEEALKSLNESEGSVRDMMNNKTFIEYVRRLIEYKLKRHKIKYVKRLDFSNTVLRDLREDKNSKLFQFAITLAEGVEFLIQVSSFPPLNKQINTIRIKLWYSKSEEATSMEVYNGIDKNYYRLFDNIIISKMKKYMLPFTTKLIKNMNESGYTQTYTDQQIERRINDANKITHKTISRFRKIDKAEVVKTRGGYNFTYDLSSELGDYKLKIVTYEDVLYIILLLNGKSVDRRTLQQHIITDANIELDVHSLIRWHVIDSNLHKSNKHIMNMNEYLNYKDIMYNNSNFLDKEDQLIKLHLDQLKDYESKKTILEDIFENTEEEINNGSVYKIIEDNVFMQQYISLLTKKREMLILERSIEAKEEALEVLRNELRDELIEDDGSFKEKQNEIRELNLKLNEFSNLDIMFNKWNSNISKIERDLRKGRPLSISMLDLAQ